jgi:nucleoside-diphosphate-sugar epimerase
VYGAPITRNHIIHEDQPLQISGLYTICKQASEHLCRRYRELFGLSVVTGRLGSAYGPMERGTGSRHNMSQVYLLAHAAAHGERLKICGADFLRDFCHISDVAEAFARLTLADELAHDVYNVSAGTAHTLRETCETLMQVEPRFQWAETDDAHTADIVVRPPNERGNMSIARLQHDLDFAPKYDLAQGLRQYMQWIGEFE